MHTDRPVAASGYVYCWTCRAQSCTVAKQRSNGRWSANQVRCVLWGASAPLLPTEAFMLAALGSWRRFCSSCWEAARRSPADAVPSGLPCCEASADSHRSMLVFDCLHSHGARAFACPVTNR